MTKWSEKANLILKQMYATKDQRDILEALEKVGTFTNWKGAQIQAYYLGLVRYGYGGRFGEPKYGKDKVYCPHCNQFRFKEKIKDGKCDICGSRIRDPLPNSKKRRGGGDS